MTTSTTSYTTISSPIGDLVLTAADDALTGLYIAHPPKKVDTTSWRRDDGRSGRVPLGDRSR